MATPDVFHRAWKVGMVCCKVICEGDAKEDGQEGERPVKMAKTTGLEVSVGQLIK
jgi:hypothetical protein